MFTAYPPGVIRVPSYVLSDRQLMAIATSIVNIWQESDDYSPEAAMPPRDRDALVDIQRELGKRGKIIRLVN